MGWPIQFFWLQYPITVSFDNLDLDKMKLLRDDQFNSFDCIYHFVNFDDSMWVIVLIGPQECSSRSFQFQFFRISRFFLWCIKCVSHFRFGADFLNVHGAVIPRVTCNAAFHNIFWSVTLHGADVSFYGLTLIGMREGTFHPFSFLDQNSSAEFLSKISKHF